MFKPGSLDHLQKYYNTVYKNEGYIEKNLREIEIFCICQGPALNPLL